MEMLSVAVLTLLVCGWVLRPLFEASSGPPVAAGPDGSVEDPQEAQSLRRAIYTTLEDLEFDFHTGKLSQHDYDELRARYEREALEVLRRTGPAEEQRQEPPPSET